jgi:hypothetical protein
VNAGVRHEETHLWKEGSSHAQSLAWRLSCVPPPLVPAGGGERGTGFRQRPPSSPAACRSLTSSRRSRSRKPSFTWSSYAPMVTCCSPSFPPSRRRRLCGLPGQSHHRSRARLQRAPLSVVTVLTRHVARRMHAGLSHGTPNSLSEIPGISTPALSVLPSQRRMLL